MAIAWTKIADVDGYSYPGGWEPPTIPCSAKRVCKGNGEIAGCYSAQFRVRGHMRCTEKFLATKRDRLQLSTHAIQRNMT